MTDTRHMFTDGQAYERLMGRWSRIVGAEFLRWIAVPEGKRWLDVGCGNGAFTEEIIALAAPSGVEALDPSPQQIDFARTRANVEGATFRVGDAQALPFADKSFDAATMALVISFVPDPAKAVAEMARVVRPGGWIAAYMWDFKGRGGPLTPISAAIRSLGIEATHQPNAAVSTQEAMRDLWVGAGLTGVETRSIGITVEFADFDDFWASSSAPIGPSGKTLEGLSPEQRNAVRDRLRADKPAMADGRISYEAASNAVVGRVPQ